MKFKVGDKVFLRLDNTKQMYVIVGRRRAIFDGCYDIATVPDTYYYYEAWENELVHAEEPNNILKEIL